MSTRSKRSPRRIHIDGDCGASTRVSQTAPHCFAASVAMVCHFERLSSASPGTLMLRSATSGTTRAAPSSTDFWRMPSIALVLAIAWTKVTSADLGGCGVRFTTRTVTSRFPADATTQASSPPAPSSTTTGSPTWTRSTRAA